MMLEIALTTDCCRQIVADILRKPSWSLARMARTIGLPIGYVRKVQAGEQSFQVADVEALAKACGTKAYELVFDTLKPDGLTGKDREFHDFAVHQMELHRELSRILSAKSAKKSKPHSSRSATRVAKSSPKPAARRALART